MPIRHSTRGQPQVSELPREPDYDYSWDGPEILRSATEVCDFGVFNFRYTEEELEELETCYYNAFFRAPKSKKLKGKKSRVKSAEISSTPQRFEVGSTITIRTDDSNTPGVAVIVAIFEVIDPSCKLPEDHDLLGMHLRLHWFLNTASKHMPNSQVKRQYMKAKLPLIPLNNLTN
jgi:hypothetical protein